MNYKVIMPCYYSFRLLFKKIFLELHSAHPACLFLRRPNATPPSPFPPSPLPLCPTFPSRGHLQYPARGLGDRIAMSARPAGPAKRLLLHLELKINVPLVTSKQASSFFNKNLTNAKSTNN